LVLAACDEDRHDDHHHPESPREHARIQRTDSRDSSHHGAAAPETRSSLKTECIRSPPTRSNRGVSIGNSPNARGPFLRWNSYIINSTLHLDRCQERKCHRHLGRAGTETPIRHERPEIS
jgi:hypothetical protein